MKTPRQKVAKPSGLTGRSFKFDGKALFKSLGQGIVNIVRVKWEDAAGNALDAISAVGIGNDPAALAHVLIQRAATRAMFALVGETIKSTFFGVRPYEATIEDSLEDTIDQHETFIDKNLFDHPTELPVVKGLEVRLSRWLTLLALESHVVATIVERFPSYFLYSLNEEWRTTPKLYQPILDSLNTPFAEASDREWAWRTYTSWLRLQVDESSFDEAFSLRQIYVPLRAYYEDVVGRVKAAADTEHLAKTRTIIDLQTELVDWLKKGKREDAVRVLSGGPGSGKSSFAKIFAAHVAEAERIRTLFIPLHLFSPSQDIVEEVGRFVEDILPYNPLEVQSKEPRLLIIFDGLDELANQGKAANETARLFAVAVERLVNMRNTQALRLQVLISGRELIVQGNESEFRKPHQILTLLPYLIENLSLGEESYVRDPHKIREHDQRNDWWQQYGRLTGKGYGGLPQYLQREDLEEITAQPLLNYLVALSYTRGKLDFSQDVNLNQVYEDLVNAVYDRAYEKKRLHVSIGNMEQRDFILILEEVGLAAWHGNGRTTTVREIAEHCQASGLGDLLTKFEEGARAGVTRLLAAFFFRQHEQRNAAGDQTFVFTHKSFGEYLAAKRIVRAMSRITNERETRANTYEGGWGEQEALKHWAQTTSANPLTSYMFPFIANELLLREQSYVRKIQLCFAQLFSFVLKNGMPMEQLSIPSFPTMLRLAKNCEEALLVCMALCANTTKELSPIVHPSRHAFANWYSRVNRQEFSPENPQLSRHLSYLNLSGLDLEMLNLFGGDFSHSDLSNSWLQYAVMAHTSATGAIFDSSYLENTNLDTTRLVNCSFVGVSFSNASLNDAIFTDCNLTKASFFSKLSISNAEFINTSTRKSIFHVEAAIAYTKRQEKLMKEKSAKE
jgi:hypothetical protein